MKAVLVSILLTSLSVAQSTYTLLPNGDTAPSGRVDGTIAYDPASRQVYLFGGQASDFQNDLWVYSMEQKRWSQVSVSGTLPPARWGHTLLWDAKRNRLVMFGGQSRSLFSDVWAFDVARGSWSQLARDDAGPSRRYSHSAILEPGRDRMVISHGFTNTGRFDDTWAFDLANNGWRNLTPSGTKPLRRCLHHAVYDAERSQMLLFGGCASGFGPCPLGDLWAFDLNTNTWTERTGQVKPAPRTHYGMVFDDARSQLVIFGGQGNGALNDTWEFDANRREWREATLLGAPPSGRSRHESTFGSDQKTAFFFGGTKDSGERTNELWMMGAAPAAPGGPRFTPQGVSSVFSPEGAPVAPGQLVSIFGSGFGSGEGLAFALDPVTGLLPSSGAGVSVTWNGIAAPLLFAQADQLNVQVPYELSGVAEARLVVTVNGQASTTVALPLVPTRPVLFPGAWNQDGTLNSATNPAKAGDVIVLYATGQGITVPASQTGSRPKNGFPEPAAATSLTIGGETAEILFRGQAPDTVGLMQINVRVPRGAGTGQRPVVLKIGDRQSQILVYI